MNKKVIVFLFGVVLINFILIIADKNVFITEVKSSAVATWCYKSQPSTVHKNGITYRCCVQNDNAATACNVSADDPNCETVNCPAGSRPIPKDNID